MHSFHAPSRPTDADTTQGEPFSKTKERLEKRTGIKGKAFEKIKFAIIKRYQKPVYLEDGKSLAQQMTAHSSSDGSTDHVLFEEGGASEDDMLLGLDHVDRSRNTRNGQEMFLK
jgi:ubiquitin carboxyl-terminal hydrolase 7